MNTARKNILMLGWEFPPAFTGGLGVACYNIVKSLSSRANIHLIVPFVEKKNDLENIRVTGLNMPVQEFGEAKPGKEFQEFLFSRVPVELSAYPSLTSTISGSRQVVKHRLPATASTTTWSEVSSYFNDRDLYGGDVHLRTHLFAMSVKRIAKGKEFDIIHAHDWPTFQAAIQVKRDSHKPLVLHIHALETDRAGEKTRNAIYSLEKNAMQVADKVIAVSEYTKGQIVAHYGIDENKIEVARNGAEVTERSTFKKKADEKWVAFVGRITFQKGPQFVVETASKLIRVFPNVRFIIAGNGDQFQSLIHDVARQRLGRYFSFTGFLSREKINNLLACSDAYFMPSVSEPFGLSAVEAVQQGTASVISRRSGAGEVLNNALSADFWDTDKFANYLHAVLKYPKLKSVIETKSRMDIEPITWDSTADTIMNVYRKILA